jgi:hypothetical protein
MRSNPGLEYGTALFAYTFVPSPICQGAIEYTLGLSSSDLPQYLEYDLDVKIRNFDRPFTRSEAENDITFFSQANCQWKIHAPEGAVISIDFINMGGDDVWGEDSSSGSWDSSSGSWGSWSGSSWWGSSDWDSSDWGSYSYDSESGFNSEYIGSYGWWGMSDEDLYPFFPPDFQVCPTDDNTVGRLQIFDGPDDSFPLLAELCYKSHPQALISTGKEMYMRYTNTDMSSGGFPFVARVVAWNADCSQTLDLSNGLSQVLSQTAGLLPEGDKRCYTSLNSLPGQWMLVKVRFFSDCVCLFAAHVFFSISF